jgi:hypothetical protein
MILILLAVYSVVSIDAKQNDVLTLIGVGDIMMGTDYPDKYRILPPDNGAHLFKHAKGILKRGDIVFGNLEQVLIDTGESIKDIERPNTWAFRAPVVYARNLKAAHFNVVSVSNNHAWDFGESGIASTLQALESVGIKHAGPKGDIAELAIRGTRVGLIAFSTNDLGYNLRNLEEAKHISKRLSEEYDILIVSFHGGTEGLRALHTKDTEEYLGSESRGNVVRFARSVIDQGADLVIGHGPHVPRALELYNDKLIAYSLGNFCTYGIISIKQEKGIAPILSVSLDKNGDFVRGKIYSFKQKYPGFPLPDRKKRAARLMKQLSEADFPSSKIRIDDHGNFSPLKTR